MDSVEIEMVIREFFPLQYVNYENVDKLKNSYQFLVLQ